MATETYTIPAEIVEVAALIAAGLVVPSKTGAGNRPQYYDAGTGKFARRGEEAPQAGESLTYVEPLEFFNPSQPRDKDGRWALTPGMSVATRQPAKGKTDLTTGAETTKWDEISEKGRERMLQRLKDVEAPGFGHIKTPDEAVEYVKKNILDVHDMVDPGDAAGWKQWYVGANHIARHMSEGSGGKITQDAAAAIIARLSPQKDWDQNVALAKSMSDALAKDIRITPDIAGRVAVLKAEAQGRSGTGKSGKESTLNLDPNEHMGLVGKRLSDLTPEQAAWAIRANDPNPPNRAVKVNPDGTYDMAEDTAGRPRTAWQSYQTMMSVIEIYRDQTPGTISRELGKEHKVRSFFNNISDPFSSRGDVTTDTHHYGVGLGIPVGTSHPLISSGKRNITGTGGNVSDGIRGTYALFAEATRRAAAERGILPREMQSIVWEQWRRSYPAKSRARGAVARAEAAAVQFDKDVASGVPMAEAVRRLEAGRRDAMDFAKKYAPKSGEVDDDGN